ncbi:Trk system potassium uptake protein TrkA [Anaerohalosphaera lusitana]|uniref:Trk system potassium uptake protein TrkA n=1 Tax=Anaerohalosphaera lusitana TaxID=1936003 RepID=A0A1U9NGS7_9BACT|nr:Trk system potassium transporter TrkA [Anaerohalosphaera lusitana]AQT66944.1 Trk system potassium uptake protein TrkA [Anaerohalosphaera lusitana]
MRVIIAGAGEVGTYIAERIAEEQHDVTVIEIDMDRAEELSNTLDVHVVCGSASSIEVLKKAGVEKCHLFLSLTSDEEVNIVSASVARKLGSDKTIARVDNPVFRQYPKFSYQNHFGIDEMFSPKMFAALEIASFIRNPGLLAVEYFAQGTVVMRPVKIDESSRYIEKKLIDLNIPSDVRIACVTRGTELIIPAGDTILKADDNIILIGETEKVSEFQKKFKSGKTNARRVVMLGGGRIAKSLARRLKPSDFRLTIIEQNAARCETLAHELPSATILQGDGTKLDLLMEEHVDTADFFIPTTDYDEVNIMSALQVKNLGAKKAIVLIHRPDFVHLIEDLGIDHAVSPRAIMAREVLTMLKKGKERSLADMGAGDAEILELHFKNEKLTGSELKDITLPENSLILLIKRSDKVIVPSGDTKLEQNDVLLIICRWRDSKKLMRLFGE